MGRSLEAEKDRQLASRQDQTATAFFLSRGQNGLLPFLALYPSEWYADKYGFQASAPKQMGELRMRELFFYRQYEQITNAPDTATAVRVLQEKVNSNMIAARRELDNLPRAYEEGVKEMLHGNLAMLNHQYDEAVGRYTRAILQYGADWPEVHYNRGLGYILMYNYMNGCQDLSRSSRAGFMPATIMYESLCNF